MIKAVLFDLDGTLLPMNQEAFAKAYMSGLAGSGAQHGYDAGELARTVWAGTGAMIKNDGKMTNEEVFWSVFAAKYGEGALADKVIFDRFYENGFDSISTTCGYDPYSRECIDRVKEMGYKIVLATNPIFPAVATRARMRWAGLDADAFEFYTTYENSRYCKPNLEYYKCIAEALGVAYNECLMVGNDVGEDMIAEELGMNTFLITPCLINNSGKDISLYKNGRLEDFVEYLRSL